MAAFVFHSRTWRLISDAHSRLVLDVDIGFRSCGLPKRSLERLRTGAKAASAAPAAPQTPAPLKHDDTVLDVTGPWDFAGLKGDPVCRLNFTGAQMTGAWKLEKTGVCDSDFPILAKVTSWVPRGDGDLALTDNDRNVVLLFRLQDDGLYASITRLEETYYLTNQDNADFAAPLPKAQIEGRWLLNGADGKVLCTLDVKAADDAAASGEFARATPCPRGDLVKDAVSFTYTKDRFALLAASGREVMAFTPGDSGAWRRSGAGGEQIFMTR
jgi:hypothetical protein